MRPGATLPAGPEVGPALVVALADEVGAGVASRRAGGPSLTALAPAPGALAAARTPTPRPASGGPAPGAVADALAEAAIEPALTPAVATAGGSAAEAAVREVVLRPAEDAPRGWAIAVGRYGSRYLAERALLRTALTDMEVLDGSMREVVRRPTGFEATFVGLTRQDADRACRRIRARGTDCEAIGG